jgi:hypothetical protein
MSIGRECGCYSLEIILNTGVYILKDTGGGGVKSEKYERGKGKGGKF